MVAGRCILRDMPTLTAEEIAARHARRRVEDTLIELGAERSRLEHEISINQQEIRALLKDAREIDITVRDISRMTGLSTQTLHTWMRELMQPIPDVQKGLGGPPPRDLCEAVLRVMCEQPAREWTAYDVRDEMPADWPNGTPHQVQLELSFLSRSLKIWRTDNGFRIFPPRENEENGEGS
jgi:hypothetical protein